MQAFPGTGDPQRTFRYRLAVSSNVFARARSRSVPSRAASARRPSRSDWRRRRSLAVCARLVVDLDRSPTSRPAWTSRCPVISTSPTCSRRPRRDRPVGHRAQRLGPLEPAVDHRRHDRQPVGDQLRRPAPVHPRHLEARGGARQRRGRLRARHRLRALAQRPHAHRLGGERPCRGRHRARPVLGRGGRPRPPRDRGDPPGSPRLQPLGIIVNRARVQSLEHQFRIKELRDMFGPLVLSPASCPSARRCSRRRAPRSPCTCGPARAPEMSNHFDQLLEQVLRTARIGEFAAGPRKPPGTRLAQPLTRRTSAIRHTTPCRRAVGRRSGDLARRPVASRRELVDVVGRLRVEFDERGLDLASTLPTAMPNTP